MKRADKNKTKQFALLMMLCICMVACKASDNSSTLEQATAGAAQPISTPDALVSANATAQLEEETYIDEPKIVEVVPTDTEGEYDLTYDKLKHRIIVCAPDNIDADTDVIIMLHGYGSTASDFKRITNFDQQATSRNYIVVYITGAPEKNDPTSSYGWNASWNSRLTESEKDDVGLLVSLAKYIQETYELESDRAYVVGFSNGGFMTFRLAIEASDTFTACVSVSGKMTNGMWQHRDNEETSGFMQINGTADDVVPMRSNVSYLNSNAPAIEEVIEYLASVNGCDKVDNMELSDRASLTMYTGDTTKQIWEIIIDEGGHCWPDAEYAGFDVNQIILDYFELYREDE